MNPSKDRSQVTPAIREQLRATTKETVAKEKPLDTSQVSNRPFHGLTSFPLGYVGYVPGIKSENVFGETYGKASFAANSGKINRGVEDPVEVKYSTLMKSNFVDHASTQHASVAATVGVPEIPQCYNQVS